MTACVPEAIAARNGSSAASRSPSTTGRSRWESTDVSPWPGKCLAQAATPCRCVPSTKAATWRATSPGSEPKLRTPITGLCASTFTSATGARFTFTPTPARRAAIAEATSRVRSTSSTTPSARFPGYELPPGRLEPGHVTAFLVEREKDLARAPEAARQRGELLRAPDVVREERDSAEPAVEPAQDPVRRLVAREAREQAGRGEPLDAHDFTAPAVSPNAIRRCTITKKIITGIAVSVAAAISEPQSVPREVVKLASQIVSVCFSWLERST